MLPLIVRPITSDEVVMVLANWKGDIRIQRGKPKRMWGDGMENDEFWAVINHVLDRITLPSCTVYVGCHENEPETPVCWAAVREGEILHLYARWHVMKDPELAAAIQRQFFERLEERIGATTRATYNPFQELQR